VPLLSGSIILSKILAFDGIIEKIPALGSASITILTTYIKRKIGLKKELLNNPYSYLYYADKEKIIKF